MTLRKLLFAILLGGLLLSACAGLPATLEDRKTPLPPQVTPTPPAEGDAAPYPPAVTTARQALADILALDPSAVIVAAYTSAEWGDSCLNLGGAAESCLQVITPGYRVVLQIGDKYYVFHTNQEGTTVRQELEPAGFPQAALNARAALAGVLKLPNERLISILRAEAVEWPDSCLGVSTPDVMCAQVITPGYRVLLEANGWEYEYHTNADGSQVVPVDLTLPSTGATGTILTWKSPDEPCQRIEINAQGASYGACTGPLTAVRLSSERQAELDAYQAAYANFFATTPSGSVIFQGQGKLVPESSEKRALAEWARLILLEAQSGTSTPDQGLAFTWHREGGIAGFCDDLLVYAYGKVQATDCKFNPANASMLYLDAAQLDQLFLWLDAYLPIQEYQTDPAVADAMTVELLLNGTGIRAASDEEKQALLDFASMLYIQAMEQAAPTS